MEEYTEDKIKAIIFQITGESELKKRGFVEGAKFDSVHYFRGCDNYIRKLNQVINTKEIHYDFEDDAIYTEYGVLYEKGRWATLVKEESLEDRVTELEKKAVGYFVKYLKEQFIKNIKYMDIERAECDFCKEVKNVERTYLRPSKYTKPSNIVDKCNLYNEGNYFIIVRTCKDCGVPKI